MSLKAKTISGIFWTFLQKIGSKIITIITTIILARLLTPQDFGLIGMLTVFIALSETLVGAGFSQALIQKKNTDDEDFSAVFIINLIVSTVLYFILFFGAPYIASFYNQPILVDMTRVLSLIFVINAFSYVQKAKLTKELRFKTLMIIQLPSTMLSGIVAVVMAYKGFGVWSIIAQQLVSQVAFAIQIWIYGKWKPLLIFNKKKARRLFSFGSNLMFSGIIHTIYTNIYIIIIGRFFPIATLGYYRNANALVELPTQTISDVVKSVTFPIFSSIQDDNERLKIGYKYSIQQILFWLCPILILAAVLATPLFRFVLTDKWLPAVPFFRILCLAGILYPLNSYNINIINVKGRSDIVLKLDIIKKAVVITGIFLTIPFGIWVVVLFQPINAIFAYFLNSYYSGRFIDYSIKEQVKDIFPIFVFSAFMAIVVAFVDYYMKSYGDFFRLLTGLIVGSGIYIGMSAKNKYPPFLQIKSIIEDKLRFKLKIKQ